MENERTVIPGKQAIAKAIVVAGLVAGTLDGLGAILTFLLRGGKDPVKIFNFIASGVFGESGLKGGTTMALAGLIFHLCIATIWAAFYFIIYPKVTVLAKSWVASGLSYGIVVWLGMNLVVVPLSSTPPLPMGVQGVIVGSVVLMICVGLPISFLARKFYAGRG